MGQQIWVLGIIDNYSKDFRLNLTLDRNQETLESFITRYVEPGNVTDGLWGYDFFLSNTDDYCHDRHVHGGGDFEYGLNSTSHIESIWEQLKACIKNIYYIIPNLNILLFLREAEFRIKNNNKNLEINIKQFFDCFDLVFGMNDEDFNQKNN